MLYLVRTSSASFGCRFRDETPLSSIGDTRGPLSFSSILFQFIFQLIGRRTTLNNSFIFAPIKTGYRDGSGTVYTRIDYWADILLKENLPENKNILIIGGGLIGVDIATAMIPRNNKVIIVKRTTDVGEDMETIAKTLSLKTMREKETIFSDYTHIKKTEGKTVYAEKSGTDICFDDIDIIVVSTSMTSYNPWKRN